MTDHEHEDECDCTEDYGPCESHSVTLVSREGASTRTADELAAVFLDDVRDLYTDAGREAPTGDHYLVARDYWQAVEDERVRERERASRDGGYAYVSGWAPTDGTITREDGSTYTWDEGELGQALSDAISAGESDLCDIGLDITWEDGYRIYRTTGGPLVDEDEDEAPAPAPVPVEPTYLRNECLTCGAPMLGVHYHEAEDEDEDEDEDGDEAR